MFCYISKKVVRVGTQIIRQISNFSDDLGESLIEAKKVFLNEQDNKKNVKSLKIAILGLPNAGKSTLINNLIGRPVCAASSKIHTTRKKAEAVLTTDDTQLIFLDTPGLVEQRQFKKFNLENSFKIDPKVSITKADVIGVVQDMRVVKARESIHEEIINLLKFANQDAISVLILNKVDTLKNKKLLLDVVKKLTEEKHFCDVFMISALKNDGVDDLRNYFLDCAKNRCWDYKANTFTDQSSTAIIEQAVKAKFLDNLHQEIPYSINITTEHIEYYEDDSIDVIVNVHCRPSLARMIIGKAGAKIKKIAKDSEQVLCQVFRTTVRLKIVVPIKEEVKLKQ